MPDATRTKNVEAAQRIARSIATTITLEHRDKLARARGDRAVLLDVLAPEIEEGRALFESKVDASVLRFGLYARAIEELIVEPHTSQEESLGRIIPVPTRTGPRTRVTGLVVFLLALGALAVGLMVALK
jgi:hypothetical protein